MAIFAKVNQFNQSSVLVGEPVFMDNDTRINFTAENSSFDVGKDGEFFLFCLSEQPAGLCILHMSMPQTW